MEISISWSVWNSTSCSEVFLSEMDSIFSSHLVLADTTDCLDVDNKFCALHTTIIQIVLIAAILLTLGFIIFYFRLKQDVENEACQCTLTAELDLADYLNNLDFPCIRCTCIDCNNFIFYSEKTFEDRTYYRKLCVKRVFSCTLSPRTHYISKISYCSECTSVDFLITLLLLVSNITVEQNKSEISCSDTEENKRVDSDPDKVSEEIEGKSGAFQEILQLLKIRRLLESNKKKFLFKNHTEDRKDFKVLIRKKLNKAYWKDIDISRPLSVPLSNCFESLKKLCKYSSLCV